MIAVTYFAGVTSKAFAAELGARSGVPVELWDERLSSVAAHEILDEAGHDRRDRKQVIDQVAAVVILRGWMEANFAGGWGI